MIVDEGGHCIRHRIRAVVVVVVVVVTNGRKGKEEYKVLFDYPDTHRWFITLPHARGRFRTYLSFDMSRGVQDRAQGNGH